MIQDIRGIIEIWCKTNQKFKHKELKSSNQWKRRSFKEERKQLFIYDQVSHARETKGEEKSVEDPARGIPQAETFPLHG